MWLCDCEDKFLPTTPCMSTSTMSKSAAARTNPFSRRAYSPLCVSRAQQENEQSIQFLIQIPWQSNGIWCVFGSYGIFRPQMLQLSTWTRRMYCREMEIQAACLDFLLPSTNSSNLPERTCE